MADIRSLLFPDTIAVVGASPRNVAAVETVVASGVRAWGVNPNRDEVAGLRCYPSVAELPEVPVCAFLMVNHERVEAAFEEAAAAGVRAFVVPGVGAEAGEAAKPATERLARRARELGATLLGPNCMGFFVPGDAAAWNGRPLDTTAAGHVAVLCQSGSIADAFLSLGGRIGLRCVVSSGAEAVTDAADFVAFFAEDPGTRAVGLFLETVRRPDAFVDALRRCAEAGKPVVCLKVGRSEAAARAALSHTGALVGSDRAFSAVLRRYSAVEVGDFHELVETLEILGRDRWPSGTRIAGVSESGGECALLADHAESAGIPFEPLSSRLAHALSTAFPNYLAPGNPLDAWGIADETEVYPRSLELLAESGEIDVLFAQADLSQFRDETNDEWCELTLRTLARLARDNEALFCAMTTVHSADPPRHFQELARELDVPLLRGPRDAMLALANVARRRPFAEIGDAADVPDLSDLLSGSGTLSEHESSLVLERLGVPFAQRIRAATPKEAAVAASAIGARTVVKSDGPAHKARSGGVVLGIETPDEAAEELDSVHLASAPLDIPAAADLVSEAGIDDPHGVVAATVAALGDLALAHPQITSLEVNPLIVGAADTVAVDALVVLAD
jgi:acetate---CoA ligase (ADP-forming)